MKQRIPAIARIVILPNYLMNQLKYILVVLFVLSIPLSGFCQCLHLSDSSITYFNGIIDSLENQYESTKGKSIQSLPQSFGHYFWLETDQAEDFIHALENNIPIDSLVARFPDMVLTKNLLLVRHTLPFLINGKQRTSIHGLPQRWDESFELNLDTARIHKHGKIEIYWQKYKSYDWKPILCGFWIEEEFKTWQIPVPYSDWAHYHNVVTVADEKLFIAQSKNPSRISEFMPSILDTITEYYGKMSGRPDFHSFSDPDERRAAYKSWNENFARASDSLFQFDSVFRLQLKESYDYSMNNHRDNDYLIAWVERYYSDEEVLRLMRNNQRLISHYPDMKPILQKQKMAAYALKTKQWPTFVKSMIGVGEYSIADTCQNYIPGALENYYVRNLAKLKLDIVTITLALTLRNENNFGYNIFGPDYSNIVRLIRLLDYQSQEDFENGVVQLIKDEHVDPLNKYYFYLAYCEYLAGNLRDSRARHTALTKADYLLEFLPIQIQSNFNNPHQALFDLLQVDKSVFDNFRIVYHDIVTGPGNYSDYDYWSALIYEKQEKYRIYYQLYMIIDSTVTPLSNFLDMKDKIRSKIANNTFVMNLLELDSTAQLKVQFTKDNTFDPKSFDELELMPKDQFENISFEDAIVFDINSSSKGRGSFILLNDNRLLLTSMTYNYQLGSYSFKDLFTVEGEGFSGGIHSYKIFNEKGEMQN